MAYQRPKDKFYTLAREQGYRSRAAFKLIQIHKKLDIYSGVKRAIDLCAAPGSWLQVLNKECSTLKQGLGLDLERIKPIPNMKTQVCNINTEEAEKFIESQFKKQKADLILCDGAANVRGEYFSDSVQQNTLVISSVKICAKFLKLGGTFVTKFYRSEFYDKTLEILKKLFMKVESFKPQASRKESAETYIICKLMRRLQYYDKEDIVREIEQLFRKEEDEMKTPIPVETQTQLNPSKSIEQTNTVQGDKEDGTAKTLYNKELTKKEIDSIFKRKEENVFEVETKTIYLEDFLNRMVNPETLLYLDTLSIREEDKLEGLLKGLNLKSNKKNLTEEVIFICKNIQMIAKTEFNFLLKLRKLNTKRIKEETNKTKESVSDKNEKENEVNNNKRDMKEVMLKIEKTKAKVIAKEEKKWQQMMNVGEGENKIDMDIEDIKNANENDIEFPIQQIEALESAKQIKKESEEDTINDMNSINGNSDIDVNREDTDKKVIPETMNYDKYLRDSIEHGGDFKQAQFLAIARKMMTDGGEEELETKAFNKYCFVQDNKTPSWFLKDEINANDKKNMLTTSEIDAELKLLNRVKQKNINKKEQEAKLRQAARKTKKIKKLNRLLDKDTEYTNKEIKGMISNISKKRERPKQYEVVKGKGKGMVVGKAVEGKSRKVFVDKRMKKDKKREKMKKRRGNKFLGKASRKLQKYKRKRN